MSLSTSMAGGVGGGFYDAYGEQWPIRAATLLFQRLTEAGLKYNEDYHFMIVNHFDIMRDLSNDSVYNYLKTIKSSLEQNIGSLPITVGLQFHIGPDDDGYIREDHLFLQDPKNIPRLKAYFRKLCEIGKVQITELDFDDSITDLGQKSRILNNIFTAAIESEGCVENITFWGGPLSNNTRFKPDLFSTLNYQPMAPYYSLIGTAVRSNDK